MNIADEKKFRIQYLHSLQDVISIQRILVFGLRIQVEQIRRTAV